MHAALTVFLMSAIGALPLSQELKLSSARSLVVISMVIGETSQSKPADDDTDGGNKCTCNGTKRVRSGDGLIDMPCPCGRNCKCKKQDQGSLPPGAAGAAVEECLCVDGKACTCNCQPGQSCKCGADCVCHGRQAAEAALPDDTAADDTVAAVTSLPPAATPQVRQAYLFVADWCMFCPELKKMATALKRTGHDVGSADSSLYCIVDADLNPDLVAHFDVTVLPTIVVTANGNVVERYAGATLPKDAFELSDLISGPPVTTPTTRTFLAPNGKRLMHTVPSAKPTPVKAQAPRQKAPPVVSVKQVTTQPAYYDSYGNCIGGSCMSQTTQGVMTYSVRPRPFRPFR